MKKLVLVLAAPILLLSAPLKASAMEPFLLDHLQWDQRRIEGEISQGFYLLNDHPVQLNGNTEATREFNLKTQFRFFDNPTIGRGEIFVGLSLPTSTDIYDAMKFTAEAGYTFLNNRLRVEIGFSDYVNIGVKQPEWGGSQKWLGASGKFLSGDDYLLTAYGRYYFHSDIPAHISNTTTKEDPLTVEFGAHGFYRPLDLVTVMASPYMYLDKEFKSSVVGLRSAVRYYIGKQFRFLPEGIALELAGDVKFGLASPNDGNAWSQDFDKSGGVAKEVQLKLVWEFK